ncbi:secreted protein [Melampsora americana]|nr:secreted protein [Melampsora americana]
MHFRAIPLYNIVFLILAVFITTIGCPRVPVHKWWYTASPNLKLSAGVYIKQVLPDTKSMVIENTEKRRQLVYFWEKGRDPGKSISEVALAPGASQIVELPKGIFSVGSDLNPIQYRPKEE